VELKVLHQTIQKVLEDMDRFSFNTTVSQFMICVGQLTDLHCNKRAILEPLTILISSFAPHITEELWNKLDHNESISFADFPQFNKEYVKEDNFEYPVSFNGKMRFKIELSVELNPKQVEEAVLASPETIKWLQGKTPKKVIVVPKRIVNVVVS
jgi:leucyl-tRNA synthetase